MTNPKAVVSKNCRQCNKEFSLPRCRDKRNNFCSSECGKEYRANEKAKLNIECQSCGTVFRPRPRQVAAGVGKFCSAKCRTDASKGRKQSAEWVSKRVESSRGKTARSGESNSLWMGGQRAYAKRRVADGSSAAALRRYRGANLERVREWGQRRRGLKTGRLPNGVISFLYKSQKGLCVICRVGLNQKYHVDHITPIKLGGKHEKNNIQLLCPSCNVRKSAKHPIDFMQERGFLL